MNGDFLSFDRQGQTSIVGDKRENAGGIGDDELPFAIGLRSGQNSTTGRTTFSRFQFDALEVGRVRRQTRAGRTGEVKRFSISNGRGNRRGQCRHAAARRKQTKRMHAAQRRGVKDKIVFRFGHFGKS